jgi:hypothetical protein
MLKAFCVSLALLVLCAVPSEAAVTWVQQQLDTRDTANGVATTFTYTLLNTVTAGDCMAGALLLNGPNNVDNLVSVTDNAGNNYQITGRIQDTNLSQVAVYMYLFGIAQVSGTPTTITVTVTTAPTNTYKEYIWLDECRGAASIDGINLTLVPTSTTTPGTLFNTTGNDLIWGGFVVDNGSTVSAGPGATLRTNDVSFGLYSQTQAGVAAGSQTAAFGCAPACPGVAGGIAFSPSASAPVAAGGGGSILLLGVGNFGGGGCGPDPAPFPATSMGFTCETFSWNSSVDTAAQIDTTQSRAAGFKWYGNAPWPNAAAGPGNILYGFASSQTPMTYNQDYTLSGGNLTIQSNYTLSPNVSGWLESCSPGPGGVGVVGHTFTGGFYIESVATWAAGPGGYSNGRSPLVWLLPTEFFNGGVVNDIPFIEVDQHESQYLESNLHYWEENAGVQVKNDQLAGDTTPASDVTGFPYGMLSATAAQNGGAATLKLYYNNSLAHDYTYTYPDSDSTALALLTQNHSCILLQGDGTTGSVWPMHVQKVRVWQAHP